MTAMTRRRLAAIALGAGLAVVVAGQLGGRLGQTGVLGSPGPVAAATATQPVGGSRDEAGSSVPLLQDQTARLAAAQSLLSARAAAVRARSKSSWMALLDLRGAAFRKRQSVMFDNLLKLPLGQFSYDGERPAPALTSTRARQLGPQAWATTITGTYSLAGFDRAPQHFEATYTLVRRPGGWRIADDTDGATPLQMWDLPGLRVLRGRSGMVIGNAPKATMLDYRTMADSAVRRVTGAWGRHWSSHVVVVTPSTKGEFARLLSRPADKGLDQVAAITLGVVEPGRRAQGDRVVINPKAFTALEPRGRQVVITHEVTHVAVRSSTTSPAPIWLTEGMADYIAYSGLDLPPERLASELLSLVRAGKGPSALPVEADFDPSRSVIATSYSASWLAVSFLVNHYHLAKVVAFYRAVTSDTTLGRVVRIDPGAAAASAFPTSFGMTQEQFVDDWRRYLRALANARR